MRLPTLPRKYVRLPRVGKPRNPFKAGTKATTRRVKGALGAHAALFAANQIPGKPFAAGAAGFHAGGPAGATAAVAATEAASVAVSALLARSVSRRKKLAGYLSRRGKRRTGIYKTGIYKTGAAQMDSIDELYDTIEKAGLMGSRGTRGALAALKRPSRGKLSIPVNARAARATNYLMDRLGGKARSGRQRRGIYKSLDELDTAIEKARVMFRGRSETTRGRLHVARHGDVFAGAGPAGRVSAKESKSIGGRLKRKGVGLNAAAGKRMIGARGKRFQRMFGARK